MGVFKDSSRQCRELALAVVAIKISAVVLLMIDFVMHASALGADISVLILRFHDEVDCIVLRRELLEKFKLVHSPFVWLHRKGRDYNDAGVNFATCKIPL